MPSQFVIGHFAFMLTEILHDQVWMLSGRCEQCGAGWNVGRGDTIWITIPEVRTYYTPCPNCQAPTKCSNDPKRRFDDSALGKTMQEEQGLKALKLYMNEDIDGC
jgi:hypothetical protein